jgi:hypothetical protein
MILLTLGVLWAVVCLAPARAQSGSDVGQTNTSASDQTFGPALIVGVYGGVPPAVQANFSPVSARLTSTSLTPVITITLPLNGAKNYVFYYAPTSTPAANRFLPAGSYRVDYINALGGTRLAGSVTYAPGTTYLNGVQVPNNPPNTPVIAGALGIQGTVKQEVGGIQPETILPRQVPIFNATVELLSSTTGKLIESVPTNGNGFYSFYYTLGVNEFFVLPDSYTVSVTYNFGTLSQAVDYAPSTDPTSPDYFVLGAQAFANFLFYPGPIQP